MIPGSTKARLLVAAPGLLDPNFARTVVLVLEHNADGALGIVLNRPSDVPVSDPLPQWSRMVADPPVVFVGGPVSPDAAICLARTRPDGSGEGWDPIIRPLGTFDLHRTPEDAVGDVDRLRIFAGYAGWGEGQLEDELEEGAWFVCDADPEDALMPSPDDLWRFVLRRQGGQLAMVANYPPDPSVN